MSVGDSNSSRATRFPGSRRVILVSLAVFVACCTLLAVRAASPRSPEPQQTETRVDTRPLIQVSGESDAEHALNVAAEGTESQAQDLLRRTELTVENGTTVPPAAIVRNLTTISDLLESAAKQREQAASQRDRQADQALVSGRSGTSLIPDLAGLIGGVASLTVAITAIFGLRAKRQLGNEDAPRRRPGRAGRPPLRP